MGYTNYDFMGSKMDKKSTPRYLKFIGGNLVTWRSKKHNMVLLSGVESEYRTLYHGIIEISWLNILLSGLCLGPKESMTLLCDNTATIVNSPDKRGELS